VLGFVRITCRYRLPVRCRLRWDDNTETDIKEIDWILLARDIVTWLAVLRKVIPIRFHKMRGIA
jgi:hypothetical protein